MWMLALNMYKQAASVCFRTGSLLSSAKSVTWTSSLPRRWALTTTQCIDPNREHLSVTCAVRNFARSITCASTWRRHTASEMLRSLNVRFATGDSRRSSICDITWRKCTQWTNVRSVCQTFETKVRTTWRRRCRTDRLSYCLVYNKRFDAFLAVFKNAFEYYHCVGVAGVLKLLFIYRCIRVCKFHRL